MLTGSEDLGDVRVARAVRVDYEALQLPQRLHRFVVEGESLIIVQEHLCSCQHNQVLPTMRKLVKIWDTRPGVPFVMAPRVVRKGVPKGEDLWVSIRYYMFEDRCLPTPLLPDDQKSLHIS